MENEQISEPPAELFLSGFEERHWLNKHGKGQFIVFSDEALFQLRKYFDSLDQKGQGSIGVQQLEDPFIALGLSQTRQEVQELVKSVDLDGSGKIEFDEFLCIMSKIRKGKKQKSVIYDFFKKMSSGDLGDDMDKNLPFRLNVSQYRRRKILDCIMTDDKQKKQKGNKILQAFKKQITLNSSLKQPNTMKKVNMTGGIQTYHRILQSPKRF